MKGMKCKFGYVEMEKCLECPNRCIDATPIKVNIAKSKSGYFHDASNEYHVTSLIGCPRKSILDRLCGQYPPIINIWKMQLGTLCHEMCEEVERSEGKGLAEMMLTMPFFIQDIQEKPIECVVKGKFDFFEFRRKIICDHKFKWKFNLNYLPSKNHFRQLAVYELLARHNLPLNNEKWANGGQINYYDIETGQSFRFAIEAEAFYKYVDEMRLKIPEMLFMICDANFNRILPPGDRAYQECFYCAPEIKQFCKTMFPEKLDPIIEKVLAFRKEVNEESQIPF